MAAIYRFDLIELAADIYSRLVTDTQVTDLVGGTTPRIYNYVPENTQFNHIRIGTPSYTMDETKNRETRLTGTMNIDIFGSTTHKGEKEAYDISQAVYQSLHHQNLDTDNLDVINLWFTNINFLRESDGRTTHVNMILNFLIKQKTGA